VANPQSNLRALVVSAMMAALAITLPVGFHAAGLGRTFSPLLLPLLLNGFLVPPGWALLTGAVSPIASGVMTGMPPFYPPVALIMTAEAAELGGVASGIFRWTKPRIWLPLGAAVILGRFTNLVLTWQLAGAFGLPQVFSATASLVQSLPGTILQCTVVPVIVRLLLERRSLLLPGEDDGQARAL
jgi:hypothetical protein